MTRSGKCRTCHSMILVYSSARAHFPNMRRVTSRGMQLIMWSVGTHGIVQWVPRLTKLGPLPLDKGD